jgi:hypothetical protein
MAIANFLFPVSQRRYHRISSLNTLLLINPLHAPGTVGQKKGQKPNHITWSEFLSNGKTVYEEFEENSILT